MTYGESDDDPVFSPDGARIAFAHEGDLVVKPANGSGDPVLVAKKIGDIVTNEVGVPAVILRARRMRVVRLPPPVAQAPQDGLLATTRTIPLGPVSSTVDSPKSTSSWHTAAGTSRSLGYVPTRSCHASPARS